MQLFVPTIGSKLKLSEEWRFNVYSEHRNISLGQFIACPNKDKLKKYCYPVENIGTLILPKDTVLKLDRIFIRKDMDGFDSMSFFVESTSLEKDPNWQGRKSQVRFWAKLEDCNTIKFEFTL